MYNRCVRVNVYVMYSDKQMKCGIKCSHLVWISIYELIYMQYMQCFWSYFSNSIFWSDFKKKLIENATISDYITIDEKMHTSANDGHLFTQYEK